jgi:hypothetical protein
MSKLFTYTVGEKLVFDTKEYDLKNHNGELVEIVDKQEHGSHDYFAQFEDNQIIRVKEKELQPLRKEFHNMSFQRGQKVRVMPKDEKGTIQKLDWLHGQAEVLFGDKSYVVVGFEKLRKIEGESVKIETVKEVVKVNSQPEDAASRIIKLLLTGYKNQDGTYTLSSDILHKLIEYGLKEASQ